MLLTYPREVIEQAADPARGVPAKLPRLNLAEIKKLLDVWAVEHHEHLTRLERARLRPLPRLEAPREQGDFANIFVPEGHARYEKLCEWTKTAELKFWKFGRSSDNRPGLWVSLDVWEGNKQARATAAAPAPDWSTLKLRPETMETLAGRFEPPPSREDAE